MARQLSCSLAAARKTLALSSAPCPLRPPSLSSLLRLFSTTTTANVSDPPPLDSTTISDPKPQEKKRRSDQKEEPLDETICYMMSRRPWTTRLQNSIRSLVPHFDQPLVLSILRKSSNHPTLALQFFRWVEKTGFRHDQSTYSEMIPILAGNSMLNHARCLMLDDMPKRNIQLDETMFASLLEAYGKEKIPQEVVKMFNKMPELGVPRTVRSYDAFFKGILCNGRAMMAKRVFNKMIRDGISPEVSTYNILIWGFSLCLKMETATRFFADMKQRGISPDVITYNNLLNGWVRVKKMEDAKKVFDEMSDVGLNPNSVTYNIMIKGFGSVGKTDDALKMFEEMREKGLRLSERTFAGLMPGICEDRERVKEALQALNEMAERKLTPKDKSVFVRLVSTLCESGDLDGAVQAHEKITEFRNVKIDPTQYGVLIENLCKGDKYDNAVKLLDEMLDHNILLNYYPNSSIEAKPYEQIIEYLCNNGNTNKAELFFRQLMKHGSDDQISFNNLIKGHAKEGSTESASEILNIMTRRGVITNPDSHSLLVESFLKKNEPSDAKRSLDSMIEQGYIPNSSLFRSVIEALFQDGRVQTASRVMKSMVEKGVRENSDLVHQILEELFTRGHLEEAVGRVNLLLENNCLPDLDGLITALCEKEKVVEAVKLAEFSLERNCDVNFESYDKVLDGLAEKGETMLAYSLLCKIKEKGGAVDKKGCDELVKKLNEEGNTKQSDILARILAGKNPALGSRRRGNKVDMEGF
ncbi:hypothetical protein LUZ60_014124 [Juncus effusus]|nr:hypothetical protein LUZ60_014124 [Juncus effusus]